MKRFIVCGQSKGKSGESVVVFQGEGIDVGLEARRLAGSLSGNRAYVYELRQTVSSGLDGVTVEEFEPPELEATPGPAAREKKRKRTR